MRWLPFIFMYVRSLQPQKSFLNTARGTSALRSLAQRRQKQGGRGAKLADSERKAFLEISVDFPTRNPKQVSRQSRKIHQTVSLVPCLSVCRCNWR